MSSDSDLDYRFILEALEKAEAFFKLRDMMNSRCNLEEPRWSPLTKLVSEALVRFKE